MKRFILTGAPGAGKTVIVDALATQGFATVAEAATDIIAEQQAAGIDAPWLEDGFVGAIARLQEERIAANHDALQFHDRSPICTYALARHLGAAVPDNLQRLLDRIARERIFAERVFFIESLGWIENNEARRIDLEQARIFGALHAEIYADLGYEIVRIPAAPVADRAARVRAHAVT